MTTTKDVTVPAGATPPASPRTKPPKSNRRLRVGERTVPYLLLLPALIAVLVLLGWPTIQLIGISFRKLDLRELVSGDMVWIGLENYSAILADPEFWEITIRTLVFTTAVVVTTLLLALFMALLMRHLNPVVRMLLQVSLIVAWATPVIATTTIFQWIFDQQYGILNKTLAKLGFEQFIGFSWFSTGPSTLMVIGMLVVWQAVPFVAFTLYAGLLGVPKEQYEAAAIDGASPWQGFWAVSWPAIRPILTMVTFLSVLWDFKVFAQVWAIRQGGPDGASTTLPVFMYLKGLAGNHFGAAATVALLMMLVLILLTARYVQLLVRSKEADLS